MALLLVGVTVRPHRAIMAAHDFNRRQSIFMSFALSLRPYLTGLETRWRLGGDSSLRWMRRRLLETSRVSGESREIQTCSIFLETFSVSSRSRRGLRDVRAQAMFWAPESPRLISLGSRGDVSLVRAQAIFWSPESPELPQLISRGSHGDVSASEIGP